MITRAQIVEQARKELGTPFKHQGRCAGTGIDCIGILVLVARALGIPHNDCTTYSREPSPEKLREGLRGSGLVPITVSDAAAGDVVEFWIRRPDRPRHVGILTGYGLLHTYADVGKVVEHHLDDWWTKRIAGAWRFPGLEVTEEGIHG